MAALQAGAACPPEKLAGVVSADLWRVWMSNLPTIEYGRPEPKRRSAFLVVLAILGAVSVILFALDAIDMMRTRRNGEKANQVFCSSNLRQIGQAILLYRQDCQGCYPPDFQSLLLTENLSSETLTCVSAMETPSPRNSPFTQSGHCSYVYVGTGLTTRSHPECIVAFEDPANHKLEGANFLFADDHVEWLDMPMTMYLLNELNVGHNPPRLRKTPRLSEAAARKDYEGNWRSRMLQLKSGPWILPATQPSSAK